MEPAEIKALRLRLGLTHKQLGDKVGVSATTVARWEMKRSEHARKPGRSADMLLRQLAEKEGSL